MKVGIYVRLSKEDIHFEKEESESIENQKKLLTEFAIKRGWSIYRIYTDDNESGKYSDEDDEREGFHSLITDARRRCFDCVLCKTQSRFSRNAAMIEKYVEHLFPQWGIRFITVVDNADNFDRRNKKARQINSLVNEWFLEDLSENIKEVYRYKMRKGEYLAPFAPFGYKKDEFVKNHLVPDEKHAGTVREIFSMYIDGMSGDVIANKLNDAKIPPPGKLVGKGCGVWRSDSIYRILRNRVYIGATHQHKEETFSYKSKKRRKIPFEEHIVIDNTHKAIIDEALFFYVQEKLNQRVNSNVRIKPELSGKIICGECKKNMHSNLNSYKKRYYRCRNKQCLQNKGIGEELVINWIKNQRIENNDFKIEAIYMNEWCLSCVNG